MPDGAQVVGLLLLAVMVILMGVWVEALALLGGGYLLWILLRYLGGEEFNHYVVDCPDHPGSVWVFGDSTVVRPCPRCAASPGGWRGEDGDAWDVDELGRRIRRS